MEQTPEEIQELIGRRLIEQAETDTEPVKQTGEDIIVHERGGGDEGTPIAEEDATSKLPVTTFAKVEKSLASLGFFTPSSRRIKNQQVKRISFTREIEGKRVEATADIIPSALFGLPITADQDKYLALQQVITDLLQSDGKIANPIRFRSADLLRLLKKSTNAGKNYNEISEWLDVMSSTTIISDGVVYIAGKKRYARDRFRVFDRAVSVGKELEDGTIADANYVWLSPWQLENIDHNFLLPIDLESYRELKNHIAKALVPLLQIWLFASHRAGTFEKRYDELCEMLTLQKYHAPSLILRQLKPSLDELTMHGYLEKWRIEKTADRKAYKVIFFHGPKFHRDRKKRLDQKRHATEPAVLIAESAPNEPALPEPGRLEDQKTAAHPPQPGTPPIQDIAGDPSRDEPREESNSDGGDSAGLSEDLPTRVVESGGEQDEKQAPSVNPALVDELSARGVMPSAAMKLLAEVPPGQLERVNDYIEYWDSIQGTKGAGLLYSLIRDGSPLPTTFETARQKRESRALKERTSRIAAANKSLQEAYEAYTRQAIDRFIEEEYPKDEFARLVESKVQEFNSQPTFWDKLQKPEITEQMARHSVWASVAEKVPVLSFEDFCRREASRILAGSGVDPTDIGIVTLPAPEPAQATD